MAIPTLSSSGWVSDPMNVLSKLYDYFLTTETNQSYFFKDDLISLQYLLATYGDDPSLLSSKTKDNLRLLLKRYFSSINVETSITLPPPENDDGKYDLTINVTVMQNGKTYSLGRSLETNGSVFYIKKQK